MELHCAPNCQSGGTELLRAEETGRGISRLSNRFAHQSKPGQSSRALRGEMTRIISGTGCQKAGQQAANGFGGNRVEASGKFRKLAPPLRVVAYQKLAAIIEKSSLKVLGSNGSNGKTPPQICSVRFWGGFG